MSYDALMRWEWEGGTPASSSGQREEVGTVSTSPLEQSQPLRSTKSWLPAALRRALGAFDV
jgi:hypothetical protein